MDILKKLLIACENYATDEIDDLTKELALYEYESNGGLVAELVRNAEQFDFVEITRKLVAIFTE